MERVKLLLPYKEHQYASAMSIGQVSDWGRTLINPGAIYTKTKGKDVNVCIIDTGIAKAHPDLKDAVVDTFNPYEQGFPHDVLGHGTHVAGIIAARDNNIGVIGIAPECNLLVAKGMDDEGFGDWNKIVSCIQWAVKRKADIINLSLGDTNEPPQIVHDAIIWAASKGVIICAAAGNDPNSDPKHPTSLDVAYPARYDEVIAVAATDKAGNLAYFSNRSKILRAIAPGVDIYSTYPPDKYAVLSGSSQASPMIVGVAALLRSYNKQKMLTYRDAIFEIQRISSKNKTVAKITSNYQIGVPSFSNVQVYSMGEPVKYDIEKETIQKLEDFDWKWQNGNFVSKSLGVS